MPLIYEQLYSSHFTLWRHIPIALQVLKIFSLGTCIQNFFRHFLIVNLRYLPAPLGCHDPLFQNFPKDYRYAEGLTFSKKYCLLNIEN